MSLWIEQALERLNARIANGLKAACREVQNEAKVVLSVPAPRRLVTSGPRSAVPGTRYYVATTPAIPGAPPRKLSGRLRASVTSEVDTDALVGRVGVNVIYGRRHELETNHRWLSVAAANAKSRLGGIVVGAMGSGV